jgi:uncharacterized protein (TIGR02001 family)
VTRTSRAAWLGAILAGAALCPGALACAQVAAQAELATDYRYRGVSLSDGAAAIALTLTYDHQSGLYGGATLVAGDLEHGGVQALSYIAYVGYARRLGQDASWDVGLTNSGATIGLDRTYVSDYTEIYAGFTKNNISAHIYYSPKYIVERTGTLYLDVDGSAHPASHWRLFGHVGVLAPLGPIEDPRDGGARLDLRAGIAREFRRCELNLAWTAATPAPIYPEGYRQTASTLVAAVVVFF